MTVRSEFTVCTPVRFVGGSSSMYYVQQLYGVVFVEVLVMCETLLSKSVDD